MINNKTIIVEEIKLIFFFYVVINKIKNIYYVETNNITPLFKIIFKLANIKFNQLNWNFHDIKNYDQDLIYYKIRFEYLNSFLENIFDKSDGYKLDYKISKFCQYWPGASLKTHRFLFFLFILNKIQNKLGHVILLLDNNFWSIESYKKFVKENNLSINFEIVKSYKEYLFINKIKILSKIFLSNLFSKFNNLKFDKKNQLFVDLSFQIFEIGKFIKNFPSKEIIYFNNHKNLNQSILEKLDDLNNLKLLNLNKKIKSISYNLYSPKIEGVNMMELLRCKSRNELENYIYKLDYNYWYNLFLTTNSKIYFTNHHSPSIIAAYSAINDLGGISVSINNSFLHKELPNLKISSDIFMSYSLHSSDQFLKNNYKTRYIFKTGYYTDYKFLEAEYRAKKIRKYFKEKKVNKIISFLDQGNKFDDRWNFNNAYGLDQFKFLFNKVLNQNNLGLIIKSKKPKKLSARLYNCSDLFDKVLKTGRCYIIENSNDSEQKNFFNIPAEISLASDICICNSTVYFTSGYESALVNKNTLFLDDGLLNNYDVWKYKNHKIFLNIEDLWNFITSSYKDKKLDDSWDEFMNKLDPFQDGKTNLRIGSILNSLHNNIKIFENRDEVLKKTAQEYKNNWGSDKVLQI